MKKRIVLVHGFYKKSKDMVVLKNNLENMNYQVSLVDLPLTYKSVSDCVNVFNSQMEEIGLQNSAAGKVSLIGHSTGGIIIRLFLQQTEHLASIGRCVLIATPNKGSGLVDILLRVFRPAIKVFKPLDYLRTEKLMATERQEFQRVEVGAIAGNNNNLLLGKLLKNENDGRVAVDSVKVEGLKDFIVLPYGHQEIHYKNETAKLVDNFIRFGAFDRNRSQQQAGGASRLSSR